MSFKSQQLLIGLLAGNYTSGTLETALTGDFGGAWKDMLTVRDVQILLNNSAALDIIYGSATALAALLDVAIAEIAASDIATVALAKNSIGIFTVVTTTAYLNVWQNTPANKARMQAQVNASGSKLCRIVQSTAGSYSLTIPADGILAMSVFEIGGGGNGGAGSLGSNTAGSGGSGAEAKTQQWTSGLPAAGASQGYVVGAAAANSSLTSFLTATAGNTGATSTSNNAGPGTTSGTLYDSTVDTAIWQPNTAVVQGKYGGGGGIAGGNGASGEAGITGSAASPGQGAAGLQGGGGGGQSHPGGGNGTAASGSGSGGGGGGLNDPSVGTGGAGTPGKIVLHYVKAA